MAVHSSSGPRGLAALGWDHAAGSALSDFGGAGEPMRVVAVHRSQIEVRNGDGNFRAWTLGRSHHGEAGSVTEKPVVGDWALVDKNEAVVRAILPRQTLIKRILHGNREQGICANVQCALICSSARRLPLVRQLQRYVRLAQVAGVLPVLALTKADLCSDPKGHVRRLKAALPEIPIVAMDARDQRAAGLLAPWRRFGDTMALLGNSGVGKSTLMNTLAAGSTHRVGEVRNGDDQGRHVTSSRCLVVTDRGCLIDTPGMRNPAPPKVETAGEFEDIEALAEGCRFRNCRHESEPGCAVQDAVASGNLRPERWREYLSRGA